MARVAWSMVRAWSFLRGIRSSCRDREGYSRKFHHVWTMVAHAFGKQRQADLLNSRSN